MARRSDSADSTKAQKSDSTNPEARDEHGKFAPGNRIWERRNACGPKPIFDSPEALWAECVAYFEWCDKNPIFETKGFAWQGDVRLEEIPKMRAFTQAGLCNFIGIVTSTWHDWKESRPDLAEVIKVAEQIIYQQKFEGAAAGQLVPMIIARDLGLSEKQEHTGKDGVPLIPTTIEVVGADAVDDDASAEG